MKRSLLILAFLPAMLIACSGGESTETQEESNPQEVQASDADLETVEETKTIETEVEKVNQDVDSILNSLEQ